MSSTDGDRWLLLTNSGTGQQLIGILKKGSYLFCPMDSGEIQKAT